MSSLLGSDSDLLGSSTQSTPRAYPSGAFSMPESLRKKVDALKLNSDSVNEPLGALPRLKKSASEVTVSANALGHVIGQARKELQEESFAGSWMQRRVSGEQA
ncbi:unnamed protein product [Prorocentrum cordatum]|uniref:Uncharacterized protein n=1 Tax=Prorocentrum cordatum TaxID=2364126 RepID=A0ABN9U9K3_9DINO|nr:unnamed protein product [Polarella glacialis]